MADSLIRYDAQGATATIALNRPDALNALTDPMKRELLDALKKVERDEAVRAVILTGEGRGFCAGEALDPELVKSPEPPVDKTLRDYYHPVNGTCAGAGVSLAMAADFRLASDKASFLMAFVKIGLVPDAGGTWFLPRLVGLSKAVEMCMTGDKVDAAEAERIGLVHRVVPHAELGAEAGKLAGKLAVLPTKAIGFMKRAFLRTYRSSLEEQLEYEAGLQAAAARTEDFHEGVQAFLDKRAPTFRGK